MNEWTEEELKEVLQKTIAKANIDVEFRKLCLENSRKAIGQMTEKEIPEDFALKFAENEETAIVMLPAFGTPEGELSDDDLEQIAGGTRRSGLPLSGRPYARGGILLPGIVGLLQTLTPTKTPTGPGGIRQDIEKS